MQSNLRRRTFLPLLVIPMGCTLHPLPQLQATQLRELNLPPIRPPATGQHWTYQVLNVYNSSLWDTVTDTIQTIQNEIVISRTAAVRGELASEIHSTWGYVRQESWWDTAQAFETSLPLWPRDLTLGYTESMRSHYRAPNTSFRNTIQVHCRVHAYERIRVPAGTFDTVRIERHVRWNGVNDQNCGRLDTLWLAPEVGHWVARQTDGACQISGKRFAVREDRLRWELVEWA